MSSLEYTGGFRWLSCVNQMASTNDIINIPAEQPCGLTLAYHLGGDCCALHVSPAALFPMSGKGRKQVGPSFLEEVGGLRRGIPLP